MTQKSQPSSVQHLPIENGYFTSPAGHKIFWRYHGIDKPRANMLLVHGIGEHSGRYLNDIPNFQALGLNVFTYDQYGHGQTEGKHGTLDIADRLNQDLITMRAFYRERNPELPLLIFGHSMGGAVVANHLVNHADDVDLAILASPALRPHLSVLSSWFADVMASVAPHFTIRHGLSNKVSHIERVNQELKADPLCHKTISGLLGQFIARAGKNARNHAPNWTVPTLLLYAGSDYLVSPKGSEEFAKNAPSLVESHCFKDYYHEIFHETDTAPVYEKVAHWLNEKLSIVVPEERMLK